MVVGDTPKKSLGQHWLHDEGVLQSIANYAQLTSRDTVLEIGPGLGTLTAKLLTSGAQVNALEFDHELAENLRHTPAKNLTVIEGDIRTFDLTTLPDGYKIVANIPYYLTSYLIRSLCDSFQPPQIAVLLMQKEVAQRIATEKKQGLLSVITQYNFVCELGIEVGKEYFTPPPKVDSQVLILRSRPQPLFSADTRVLYRLFKAGFSEKRKNLRNALSGGLALDKSITESLLSSAGIGVDRRAESLTWGEWQGLYEAYNTMLHK